MKLLFLKCGAAPPDLALAWGDYERWFARAMGPIEWDLVAPNGGPFISPDLGAYAGVIVSGSPASLTRPAPWMAEICDLVRRADLRGTPVLGVCFGHQLLGHAYGARVVRNPRGWELGTVDVDLTDAGRTDPLFEGVSPRLRVNATHEDAIDETVLPPELRVLAANDTTPVQALAAGDHVRGVQFHPELCVNVSREYCLRRAQHIGQDRAAALAQSATETPHARRVLANFIEHFVRRA